MLNIGPKADGTIPEIMEKRLIDIGTWLEKNGEAIYGTRMNRLSEAENILVDPELNSRVEALEEQASNLGIMGVPAFLYNGHYLFSGAQSAETIRLSIIKAHKRHL